MAHRPPIKISESASLLEGKIPRVETARSGAKSLPLPKHVLQREKWSRIGTICSEHVHTFDLNDVMVCHIWSGEFVHSGPLCKSEKATIVSE